jgi:polar amino acid transport system substrate-binding protein
MARCWILCILLLVSCGNGSRGVLRVGVDPNWYPIDFGPQTSYVNGYTEDLLLEIAHYSGMDFERIQASWDNLMDGLKERKYDAVLSSMPPYVFNTARYDFSSNFLALGPVLIVPANATYTELSAMKGDLIGLITNDPAVLLVEKHPTLIIRNYPTIPDLLNGVAQGQVQGALLDRIPAVNYVNDLYQGRLKIVGAPLTDKGLHLIAPKNGHRLIARFNKSLDALLKRKRVAALQQKWQLDIH